MDSRWEVKHGKVRKRKRRQGYWSWAAPAYFVRQRRRKYKARVKQCLRRGEYDHLPVARRDARYIWW